jgi:hypothetical protein
VDATEGVACHDGAPGAGRRAAPSGFVADAGRVRVSACTSVSNLHVEIATGEADAIVASLAATVRRVAEVAP